MDQRYNDDHQIQYLIKWEGEDEEYATWESYKETTEKWGHLLKQFNNRPDRKNSTEIICIDDHEDDDILIQNSHNRTNHNHNNHTPNRQHQHNQHNTSYYNDSYQSEQLCFIIHFLNFFVCEFAINSSLFWHFSIRINCSN